LVEKEDSEARGEGERLRSLDRKLGDCIGFDMLVRARENCGRKVARTLAEVEASTRGVDEETVRREAASLDMVARVVIALGASESDSVSKEKCE